VTEARLPTSSPDPAEVYEAALRYLTGIPEVDHCALFLLSASRRELTHAFSHGYGPFPVPVTLPVEGRSVIAYVARTGTRYMTGDAQTHTYDLLGHPHTRSELAIPLMAGGDVAGVLNLESTTADAFSPAVVSLCESVASGISAALQGTNVTVLLLQAKVALEKTFDAMTDLVAILDDEGRIRRLNQAMARRLQRPLRELLGEDFQALFPFCREWLAEATRTSPSERGAWTEVVDPESQIAYELNLLELDIPSPVSGNRVVFMRDVTQERELASQVIAFERRAAAGDLLTGVAHEVRNPLAAIQAAVAVLEQDLAREPAYAVPVGIICRQVHRLKVLMEDLLHIGRPFDHLSVASGSLLRVLETAVGAWRENAGNRAYRVEILAPESEPFPVRVDAARLEQVILNLLDNAAQHSFAGSAIEVGLSRADGQVRLRVRDQGVGIPPETFGRVFEPFFTTRANGTGLGLTLVKSIVEGHGGHVSLWNNEPPPGLTFEVSLPAARPEEP
jgi:signal transduction histidine kinase